MFIYWFISVCLFSAQIEAKLLHRELVSAPQNPLQICINANQENDEVVTALLPIIRFNLNLSGLIAVTTDQCANQIKLSINQSLMGTRSVELQFLGNELSRLPNHKIPVPKLNDKHVINQYANKITRTIHEYLTHHRGWHDRKIAFIATVNVDGENQYKLIMSNIDGSESKELFTSHRPLINPVFSPDSQKIALTEIGKKGTSIYIKEGKHDWEKISEESDLGLASSWSPDSQHLLIVNYQMHNPSLLSYDTLSDNIKTLMPGWSLDCDPVWAKDNFIYLASSRSGTPHIYRYELNKKLLERITFQGDGNLSPSISKDRLTMAYIQKVKDEYRLMIHFFRNPSKPENVLSGLYLQDPKISDDGSWVLLTEKQGRRNVIGLIDTHGQTHIRLIAVEGQFNHPTWVPESWST
jgi:TolB protein